MSTEEPPQLRAVEPAGASEKPPEAKSPPLPMTVLEAAHVNDQRALLAALLIRVAAAIETGCAARDLSSLSRRAMEVARELAALDAQLKQQAAFESGALPGDEEWRPEWF